MNYQGHWTSEINKSTVYNFLRFDKLSFYFLISINIFSIRVNTNTTRTHICLWLEHLFSFYRIIFNYSCTTCHNIWNSSAITHHSTPAECYVTLQLSLSFEFAFNRPKTNNNTKNRINILKSCRCICFDLYVYLAYLTPPVFLACGP